MKFVSMLVALSMTGLLIVGGTNSCHAQTRIAAKSRRGIGRTIPTTTELAKSGLTRQWWAQAGFDPSGDILKSITVDEENVYVVSRRGNLTAFDAETGVRLWVYLIGDDITPVLAPVSNSKQVLAAVGMSIVALDKYTGAVQWRLRLEGQPSTGPAVDESNVYVGTLDGRVFAYDLRKIRQLFNDGKLPDYSYNAQIWTYRAPSGLSSPPATSGRYVDFASRSGVFTSVAASDRQLQYLFESDGEILGPVARTEQLAIIPSTDRNVYCIDSRNGQVEWTFASGLPVIRPMAIVGESLYVTPGSLGLFQLDLASGQRMWSQSKARQFVASTPTSLYTVDSLDNLLVLEPKSGTVRSTVRLSAFKHQVSNSRTDRVFLSTSTGLVLCLRESGREFPIYHRYPERRPLIPEFAPESSPDSAPASDGS